MGGDRPAQGGGGGGGGEIGWGRRTVKGEEHTHTYMSSILSLPDLEISNITSN